MPGKHVQFHFNLEYLQAHSSGSTRTFGLTFGSIGLSPDVWDVTEVKPLAEKLFRPWEIPRITEIRVWKNDGTSAQPVSVTPFSWRTRPVNETPNGYPTSFENLKKAFNQDFERCHNDTEAERIKRCFISQAGSTERVKITKDNRPWGAKLGQAAILPAPIPQLLNLSMLFRTTANANQIVIAAPVLDFREFRLVPKGDPNVLEPDKPVWEYEITGTLPADLPAFAYPNPVKIEPAPNAVYLDVDRLLVKNPNTAQ